MIISLIPSKILDTIMIVPTAGTLIINTVTLPLVEFFGDNVSAWTKAFCVLGLLAVIAFLFTFFGTKERVKAAAHDENGQAVDVPFKEGLKALFKNKYWIMMTGMLALFFLMYSVNGGATVYYAKDILGDKNLVSTSPSFSAARMYYFLALGSIASRKPSPIKLKPSTAITIIRPAGNHMFTW